MCKRAALVVSGIVFGLVAIAHLLRIVYKATIVVGGNIIPMQASYIGLVVTAFLCIWMFAAASKK